MRRGCTLHLSPRISAQVCEKEKVTWLRGYSNFQEGSRFTRWNVHRFLFRVPLIWLLYLSAMSLTTLLSVLAEEENILWSGSEALGVWSTLSMFLQVEAKTISPWCCDLTGDSCINEHLFDDLILEIRDFFLMEIGDVLVNTENLTNSPIYWQDCDRTMAVPNQTGKCQVRQLKNVRLH